MANVVLVHVADRSPVVCGEEDAARRIQNVGFPVRISQEVEGKAVEGRERLLPLRVDASFIAVVQVVNDVEEGRISYRGFAEVHARIGSYEATGPVVGDDDGRTESLGCAVGQRSQRHQHLAAHLKRSRATGIRTHEGCRVVEEDVGDSVQDASVESDVQDLSAGHGDVEVLFVQNAVALQVVRFAAAIPVVVGTDDDDSLALICQGPREIIDHHSQSADSRPLSELWGDDEDRTESVLLRHFLEEGRGVTRERIQKSLVPVGEEGQWVLLRLVVIEERRIEEEFSEEPLLHRSILHYRSLAPSEQTAASLTDRMVPRLKGAHLLVDSSRVLLAKHLVDQSARCGEDGVALKLLQHLCLGEHSVVPDVLSLVELLADRACRVQNALEILHPLLQIRIPDVLVHVLHVGHAEDREAERRERARIDARRQLLGRPLEVKCVIDPHHARRSVVEELHVPQSGKLFCTV